MDDAARAMGAGALATVLTDLDAQLGFSHDLTLIKKTQAFRTKVGRLVAGGNTIADMFEATVARGPDRPCIFFEETVYTFRQVDEHANKLANYWVSQGLHTGDILALMMDNRPEYIIATIASAKVGLVTAHMNTNLRNKALLHCFTISTAKAFFIGVEHIASLEGIRPTLEQSGVRVFCLGGPLSFGTQIDSAVAGQSTVFDRKHRAKLTPQDTYGFIYTSGTTGMPKAVVSKHARVMGTGLGWSTIYEITERDRIYNALPLYHSAGGNVGLGMMMASGAAVVLRRKFSATHFMSDIRHYRCTVFQYIGELCRYLLAVEPSPLDRQNELRVAIGNGLRPDIWEKFQTRFNIPYIGEFYGSTEGNILFFNMADQSGVGRGAMGRHGYLMRMVTHARIIKYDVDADEIVRGKDGLCILCAPNEPGELVARISDAEPFIGYYNNAEGTNKKILTDVFQKGDRWYRTGDLVRQDVPGFYFFVDRTGDTFRWKGENVSTNEVAEALSVFPGVKEANVYGVEIPGKEGRAGMVAAVLDPTTDLVALGQHAAQLLPPYAIPLFLRVLPQIEITGTFKHQKVGLRNDGMDPSKVKDPLYMFNAQTKAYEPFGWEMYNRVVSGKARL